MNIPVYYVTYGDMGCLSLVKHPAIEEGFQLFEKEIPLQFSYDDEKHIVFGPAMIPDKPMYRTSAEGRPYYIVFTADVIEKMVFNSAKKGLKISLEHNGQILDNVYIVTSFISCPAIISAAFSELPYGTWFTGLKIEDDSLWADIKEGKFTGFSIEALCDINLEPKDPIDDEIDNILY